MRVERALVALAAVGALVAAGCGGESRSSSTGTTPQGTSTEPAAPTGKPTATVEVTETDFKLDPSNPTVKAGVVDLKVKNDGKTAHNLEVEGPGGEVRLPNDLQPGDSGVVKVDVSKPGKYEFYCPVDGHKGLGMKGTVTVTKGGTASSQGSGASGGASATQTERGYGY
ncbi:MAG: cupredoxin domain-containing protein [Thermoleophilaceae bacterium]|nr:cupredoxin domain-containing protein [Thermoleophilaceae bacterium]